ncbi:MAG: pyrroline-5-carboxylate reductase [Lachnospiraceae bacterium]|nr:pyrroline-5-carboxylate reductase [Lachnospiraceae bacterium]
MTYKVGFIGCGNMASAIISGILRAGYCSADEIIAAEPLAEGREHAKQSFDIHVTDSNQYVAAEAQIIFLCVKPQVLDAVLTEICDTIGDYRLLISIVAGTPLAHIASMLGEETHAKLIRMMPNTPALVGAGMTAVCGGSNVTEGDLQEVLKIAQSFGAAEIVPEHLFDAVTAVSGSSPAYVFMLIEAMADAAVKGGMQRAQAYRFAAQAVAGSAQLLQGTGRHPGELKDMVCSPAGTTIDAVAVLEERGFRSAIIEAMDACRIRSGVLKS